jgi:hypothetical protein
MSVMSFVPSFNFFFAYMELGRVFLILWREILQCSPYYCNKSKLEMDKIFFLSHSTTFTLEKLEEFLNDRNLFGSLRSDSNLTKEGNIVLGEGGDISDEEDVVYENSPPHSEEESDHDEESVDKDAPIQLSQVTPYNLIMSFGHQVIWHWNKCKQRIKHEYAIAGWALCIMEDVQKDVQERLMGTHRDAIEKVVSRLHMPPCPNTNPAVSSVFAQYN